MCLRLDEKGRPTGLDGVIQWHAERVPYAPNTATPEGAPYYIEPAADQPEGFFAFSSGMGQRVQDPKRDRDTDGYYHGHFIDGTGDILFNGPNVTQVTPNSTGPIRDFADVHIGGTDYVVAGAGQYLLRRTADTVVGWSNVAKDFGAGVQVNRLEIFQGTQTVPFLFIALTPPQADFPVATVSHAAAGGTVADGTYQVAVTYTYATGESMPSPTVAVTTAGGGASTITITSPAAATGATGWYAYVSQVGGTVMTRQQAAGSPTAVGTNLTITAPPTSTGVNPTLNNYCVWDMTSGTTVFTQHASLEAIDFLVYRTSLWMLNRSSTDGSYQVQQCLDGGTAPTWSGAFKVSDATNPAQGFEVHNDVLYVRCQRGLRTVSAGDNFAEEITGSEFHHVETVPNNCRPVSFLQWLLTPMYRSWYAWKVDGTVEEVGLTALRRNDSVVAGIPTAAQPYGTVFVLVAFYNEANNTAYLMKWGNWKTFSTLFSPIPRRDFEPSMLGALWEQSSRIDAIHVSEAAGGPFAYFGDAAGVVSCFKLPRNGSDPTGDTTWCQFNTTTPFSLYASGITRGNPGVNKAITAVEVTGQNLNATVSYRPGRTGTYGNSVNLQNAGLFNSDPGGRLNFTVAVLTRWLDLLLSGTATSASVPCIVESLVAYVIPRPPYRQVFTFKMLIGSRVVNKFESVIQDWDTKSWIAAISSLNEVGPITMITPDGASYLATVTGFKLDAFYADVKGMDIEFIGTVEAMQHLAIASAGEHAHLGHYSHSFLANYTHAGLDQL